MAGDVHVDLLGPVQLLHGHLTEALCEEVFDELRVSERRRVWTLTRMAEFWTAVILRAPASLQQALEQAFEGQGGYPRVAATKQAFFERAKGLRWEFFRGLFTRFARRVLVDHTPTFEGDLHDALQSFTSVLIVDGTVLDRVAHRLKVLWDERSVVLPGRLLVLYDLFRGVPAAVEFQEDAKAHEVPALKAALDDVDTDSLIVGDRLYCAMSLFEALEERGLHGLVRRKRMQRVEVQQRLDRQDSGTERIEDLLVVVGTGRHTPKRTLRLIRLRRGKTTVELFTNVMDRDRLPARIALTLYRRRWKIERMFYDLKVVLNLHRFYAANTNAVAMQVYAAAMVYLAMRICQARIATQVDLAPEEISPPKLYPRVAVASSSLVQCRLAFLATSAANPHATLVEPEWSAMGFATAPLEHLLVQRRNDRRRKRRRCPARERPVSLHQYARRKRRRDG